MAGTASTVPRNFKLLDELEEAEKGAKGGADISLGLSRPDDTFMYDWQASIFQSAGGGEPRIWFLTLRADDRYPVSAPTIRFTSKVTMECVDKSGNVIASKVPYLATWNPSKTMHGALAEIKALLARAPRVQPAEGTTF